jgi:diguanylate cyclase (GGDEF)-like protein/PAS domain S-box-containing protein
MNTKLIERMQNINRWQLNVYIVLSALVLSELCVTILNLLIFGQIRTLPLLVTFVVTLIASTILGLIFTHLLDELAKTKIRQLEDTSQRTRLNLEMAIEAAQMDLWEFDLTTYAIKYNTARIKIPGFAADEPPRDLSAWLSSIHPDDVGPFQHRMHQAMLPDAANFDFEYRVSLNADQWAWVHTRGGIIQRDAMGKPILAAGSTINITARKQAEIEEQEANYRFAHFFALNPDLMIISRLSDGRITDVNDAFVRKSGYSREEAIGNTTVGLGLWSSTFDRERMVSDLKTKGISDHLEAEFHPRSGGNLFGSVAAVLTQLNGVPHILSTVRDISIEKQAEEKIKQSETLLRTTLESTDEGILMIGHDGRVLSANKRFLELWRVPQSLLGQGDDNLLLSYAIEQLNDPEDFLGLVRKLYTSDEQARDVLHFKDGRVFARFTQALAVGEERGRIWCFKDITEQFHAEAELKATKERYDFATRVGKVGTWDWSPVTGLLFWSDETFRLMGFEPDSITPTYELYLGLVHPDDREFLSDGVQAALQKKRPYALDCRINLGNGTEIVCHVTGKVEFDENGQPTRMLGTIQNITERKQVELALKVSEQKLLTILDNVDAYIFLKDTAGKYLFANQPVRELWGVEMEDIVGFGDEKFFDAVTTESIRANDRDVLDRGETHTTEETNTVVATGKTFTYLTTKLPLRREDGNIYALCGVSTDITARIRSEAELQASEERARTLSTLLRLITDNVTDMIWAKDLNKRYLFANKAICDQLLSAKDTEEPIGKDDMFFAMRERNTYPDDPNWHTFGELCQDSDSITLQNGNASQFDEYGNVKGKFLFLDVHKAPFINDKGEVIGVVGSGRDVTQQKIVEEKLRLASMVLENSSEAMFITDEAGLILEVNPAFAKLTGYSADEVVGKSPSILHSGRHEPTFYQAMWKALRETGHWQGEIWNRRKNGEIFAEWQTINTIYNPDDSIHRHVALFSDITEKKKSEELIWAQANFDQLTSMPNRRMFRDRLTQDIKKAHRAGLGLALMFLDLDRFKEVNDSLGHDIGDALLKEAAQRITACVRESDTVARLGGDEFTIILSELDDRASVERIAEDILRSLTQPFELGNDTAYVSASIGITLYPEDAANLEDMLKNADQAMYVAKNAGRNRFSYFTNAMQERALHRLHMLNDLRGALTEQQMQLHYQPIVNIQTGKIHKAEALLRWFHPLHGLISPAEFIPLAEESGLIHEIGDWVFEQAVAQALQWTTQYGSDFQISVNKSPIQIQTKSELFRWKEHLAKTGLSGKNLVIEITEGVLLDSSPSVISELLAFRDAGIQVAIDDFGTGYSALSYLKKLDIDYLKIDRSFIRNLETDTSDMALAEAIVVMAHKLGLKVIAEGVETQQQLRLLAQMDCDYAQGFLYSRAVSAQDFEKLMASFEK